MENMNPIAYKVRSACITDFKMLEKLNEINKPIIISTGMSTRDEIDAARQMARKKDMHPAQALYNAGIMPLAFDQMLGIAYGKK